jgi:hypothetical protein
MCRYLCRLSHCGHYVCYNYFQCPYSLNQQGVLKGKPCPLYANWNEARWIFDSRASLLCNSCTIIRRRQQEANGLAPLAMNDLDVQYAWDNALAITTIVNEQLPYQDPYPNAVALIGHIGNGLPKVKWCPASMVHSKLGLNFLNPTPMPGKQVIIGDEAIRRFTFTSPEDPNITALALGTMIDPSQRLFEKLLNPMDQNPPGPTTWLISLPGLGNLLSLFV